MLYKYRNPIDLSKPEECRTGQIFLNSKLYFSQLSKFNDPFEGQIDLDVNQPIEEAIDRHYRVLRTRKRSKTTVVPSPPTSTWHNAKKNVEKIYEEVIAGNNTDLEGYYKNYMDNYGILALSKKRDNLLLWAHYADNYRGLCLGFEWAETDLPQAKEVIYQTNYRKTDFWFHTEDELAQIALFQKSSDWSYEQEYRSICEPVYEYYQSFNPDDSYHNKLKQAVENDCDIHMIDRIKLDYNFNYQRVKESGYGAKKFNKKSLREVVFGLHMNEDTRNEHISLITDKGFEPIFYVADRSPKRYELQLTRIETK